MALTLERVMFVYANSCCRRAVIRLLRNVPLTSVLCICLAAPCAQNRPFAPRKAEPSAMATRSLCEARGAWSCFSAGTSADDGYLVCDGAEDVEEEVIQEQRCPRTNNYGAYEELGTS